MIGLIRILLMATALVAAGPAMSAPPSLTFREGTMAVLSRAGCNSGACHGNLNGKGGFRLSLRGENPDFDYTSLTRDLASRRIDPASPDQSLILQKATGKVPHEGGIRFTESSVEYRTLREWIASGGIDAPAASELKKLTVSPDRAVVLEPTDRISLRAVAEFQDGTTRDVTRLVAFDLNNLGVARVESDGTVRREQSGEVVVTVRYLNRQVPVWIAFVPNRPVPAMPTATHPIDRLAFERFRELRLRPADLSTDEVFLRRAYLDALGTIPTVAESRSFLADRHPDKRARLIDTLLARPEFAENWAQKWSDVLRNEEKSLDAKGTQTFFRWMKAWFDEDKPLTGFAREILAARGSSYVNPAANFYRAVRDPYLRAESVAQVFLGLRVSCARCHNHPFDVWTQDDYHRFAAVFQNVDYRILSNTRKDDLDKHEFVGEQIVVARRDKTLPLPRGGTALPKLLGAPESSLRTESLDSLADWVADGSNPFFARAQVNRVWLHLFGRGLVDPNDDFRASNPASHPAVLDHLTRQFAEGGFRLKPLVRHLMTSRLYQLASSPNETNGHDVVYFSKALMQPLDAEQITDALGLALDAPVKFIGYPDGTRAGQLAAMPQTGRRHAKNTGDAERFMRTFGKPERLLTCECERSEDTGVIQVFQMITGDLVNELIRRQENRIGRLLAANTSNDVILDELYLATLTRYPTDAEKKGLLAAVQQSKQPRTAWEDIAWSLVNSKEFLLRR